MGMWDGQAPPSPRGRHRVARTLNAVAAVVLVGGAAWQVVLGFGGRGRWRLAVAAGALWLGYEALRVARHGPRIRR